MQMNSKASSQAMSCPVSTQISFQVALQNPPATTKPAPKNNSPKEAGSARQSSCANKPKPTADMATGR